MSPYEALIRRYFAACNASDHDALIAAPAVQDIPMGELVGFDYKGRGYHLGPDA
jgi:hypothetical protein